MWYFGIKLFALILILSVSYAFPSGGSIGLTITGSTSREKSIVAPLANVGDNVDTKIKQLVNLKTVNYGTPFPDSGRQRAILESSARESLPIQADIKYGNLQQFVAGLYNPKPIVDTIQEHEKYGNDGGKYRKIGTLVVGAFEGFSNAINAAADAPFIFIKEAGRKVTNSLNQIGGKLVGLA